MKTIIKTVILAIVAIGAVGGILFFVKTQVSAPENVESVDQYTPALSASVNSVDTVKSGIDAQRKAFLVERDKIGRFLAEGVVTKTKADQDHSILASKYGNQLHQYAYGIILSSTWPEANITKAMEYIDEFEKDCLTNGKPAVKDIDWTEFRTTIKNYRDALALTKLTGFGGVESARNRINQAKEFLTMPYLSNNMALSEALQLLPGKINNAHYQYVAGRVASLKPYYNYSENYYYDVLVPQVDKVIKEYKNTGIYGKSKRSIADLEKLASKYALDASFN